MDIPIIDIENVIQPVCEFWSEPKQKESNQNYKNFQFTPIPTVSFNDLDCAMTALPIDLFNTIEAQCRDWHGVKVWFVIFVRYESANPLDEHFNTFDAHLPVSDS